MLRVCYVLFLLKQHGPGVPSRVRFSVIQ
jgi:hypothetical protein